MVILHYQMKYISQYEYVDKIQFLYQLDPELNTFQKQK